MKKMILMGRVGCGKTTLTQALRSETVHYQKTQYIINYDVVVDTPGEYAEQRTLGHALALYSYECDVVGIVMASNEPYSIFEPACTANANRPVIGIVTHIHAPQGDPARAARYRGVLGTYTAFCDRTFEHTGDPADTARRILDDFLRAPYLKRSR